MTLDLPLTNLAKRSGPRCTQRAVRRPRGDPRVRSARSKSTIHRGQGDGDKVYHLSSFSPLIAARKNPGALVARSDIRYQWTTGDGDAGGGQGLRLLLYR